jgi:hypothetical protein
VDVAVGSAVAVADAGRSVGTAVGVRLGATLGVSTSGCALSSPWCSDGTSASLPLDESVGRSPDDSGRLVGVLELEVAAGVATTLDPTGPGAPTACWPAWPSGTVGVGGTGTIAAVAAEVGANVATDPI